MERHAVSGAMLTSRACPTGRFRFANSLGIGFQYFSQFFQLFSTFFNFFSIFFNIFGGEAK
jgi:hypothetical protein